MNQFISKKIACIALYLNPDFCSDRYFNFKSDDGCLVCVKRGPCPMIYLSKTQWSCDNNMDAILNSLISLYHYGLIKFPDYFRYRFEELRKWIIENMNSIVSISSISFQWYYNTDNSCYPALSPFETNYLINNNLWATYNENNFLPKRKRSSSPLTVQQFTLDRRYGARFLGDVRILNSTDEQLWDYFGDYILKSWRRHCSLGLLPLPIYMLQQGRISHKQLPKKTA